MKVIARSLVVIFVALIAVPALAVSYTITTAVQLLADDGVDHGRHAASAVQPSGFGCDSSDEYMDLAETNYIIPMGTGAATR